ncbi:MAG: ShlB/FhaC/HecB family hemolysin secretion/activation protein [Rhodocyclaceae bacterium]|nr:ShlB/FhaC/HecB family hemolysin secretion/activation protein [Rhodocyclaceae bacterium]
MNRLHRPIRGSRHTLIACALAGGLSAAHAQTPPDAGALQREAERSLAPRPVAPAVAAPLVRPMAEDAKGVRVAVTRISVEGASLIPAAELEALVADRVGQSLTLAELEHAAQRIAEHYRQRGWFVRVYLPEQDVTGGHVRIQVLEGRYGGSRAEPKGSRVNGEWVRRVVTHRLQPGEPLPAADVERGLLLANSLPGIYAAGLLEAGESQSTSRLVIYSDDKPFVTGDAALNNYGVKATGRAQAVGGVALNNLSGIGDQLALRGLAAEGLNNVQIRYVLPIHPDGWRLGAHFSALDYELGDRYRALDAEGKAKTGGLDLTYALVRQRDRNLNLGAGYEHRRYEDDALDAALRRHRIGAFTLSLSGDMRDSLHGGGISWGSVQLIRGQLDIRDVAADKAADRAGPRAEGGYAKLAFSLNRLQALGDSGWQIQAGLSGQWADGNLASSEQFGLGGPYRVRAFPVNEASGDEGVLFKLELQKHLGGGWQAVAFYDAGRIRQYKDTWAGWDGGSGQPNGYSLAGAGLGLNWNRDGWQLAASAAVPVGGNPGKGSDGRNNDGSKPSSARFWLTLGREF